MSKYFNHRNLWISLKKLINEETLIVIENHYLGSIIQKNQFDTFYHEHPRTYSVKSFEYISKQLDTLIIILKSNRIFLMKEVRGKFRAYGKV